MSFRDNFIADLPPDPADAIIILGDRAQEFLDAPSQRDDRINAEFICAVFQRFFGRYKLGVEVINTTNDTSPSVSDYVVAITRFSGGRIVDRLLDQYDLQRGDEHFGVTVLETGEKKAIHGHLSSIREILERSSLSARKKNALFGKLSAISDEVDKDGTRTDRIFAFAADAAFVVGEMAENAAPFVREVKEILKIITQSRARTEGIVLPEGAELFKLTSSDNEGGK